jgi:hypothetical protein
MKKFLPVLAAFSLLTGTVMAEPAKLNPGQLDGVAAGLDFDDGPLGGYALVATQNGTQVSRGQSDVVFASGPGAAALLKKEVGAEVDVKARQDPPTAAGVLTARHAWWR